MLIFVGWNLQCDVCGRQLLDLIVGFKTKNAALSLAESEDWLCWPTKGKRASDANRHVCPRCQAGVPHGQLKEVMERKDDDV